MALTDVEGVRFHARGLGKNWLPCLVCDEAKSAGGYSLKTDCSFFVQGRGDGYRALAVLADAGLAAHLDYRPHEPKWVQVKVAACEEHVYVLERLVDGVGENGHVLTARVVWDALHHGDPTQGGQSDG